MTFSTSTSPTNVADDRQHPMATSARAHRPQNFIPLKKADLRAKLLADPTFTARQREQLGQVCKMLEAQLHYSFHERLEKLKELYAPFDPDHDCVPAQIPTTVERELSAKEFIAALSNLLERANFEHLTPEQLAESLDQASRLGFNMEVDFHIFQRLEIYTRGQGSITRPLPGLWNRWRGRTIAIPVFQRMVLLFRLKPDVKTVSALTRDTIYIKIFKDIPKSDVDMLLPGTRVKMTWLDQGKIILPTLSGVLFTVYKILMGALKVAFAGVYGLLAVVGVLTGTIGYASRSFYNYLNTKDKYQLNLARSLYYQNLDSNAGVIFRLLDEAEEQEFREAMIAYYLLWKHAREGMSVHQLDVAAEKLIHELTGVEVDFEIADALEKLAHMKLAQPADQGKWRCVEFEPAMRALDNYWDGLFAPESHLPTSKKLVLPTFFRPLAEDEVENEEN